MGFLSKFLPNLIPALGAFANPWVLLALLGALVGSFFYGVHMEHGRFVAFQTQVKAAGEAQNARTAQRIKDDKLKKLEADYENKTTRAALAAELKRLRLANPSGGFVPAAPAGARRPDLACFDRAEYSRADGDFTAEARRLADEGTAATVDLNTAKKWAKPQGKGN